MSSEEEEEEIVGSIPLSFGNRDLKLLRRVTDPEPSGEFLSACSSLDLKKLRECVERGIVAWSCEDEVGQNGIHYVVLAPKYEPQRIIQILKYLIRWGCDLNKPRKTDGWTPIFLPVIFGRKQIVSFLLSEGAKADVRDNKNQLPEAWAVKYRYYAIKELFLHHRSKVPHSRFSCVQSGPALGSPPPEEPPESPPSESSPDVTTASTGSEADSQSSNLLKA